jgi:hypothetical protein
MAYCLETSFKQLNECSADPIQSVLNILCHCKTILRVRMRVLLNSSSTLPPYKLDKDRRFFSTDHLMIVHFLHKLSAMFV